MAHTRQVGGDATAFPRGGIPTFLVRLRHDSGRGGRVGFRKRRVDLYRACKGRWSLVMLPD